MALYAIISDIHANLAALKAVAKDAKAMSEAMKEKLSFISLGDVVDYGPDPNECMEWFAANTKRFTATIQGNHDYEGCQPNAVFTHDLIWLPISFWTQRVLKPEHKKSISLWQASIRLNHGLEKFTFTHATPCNPLTGSIKHTTTPDEVDQEFDCLHTPYGFMGHTHLPCYMTRYITDHGTKDEFYYAIDANDEVPSDSQWQRIELEKWIELPNKSSARALINPGAVGQPRPFDVKNGIELPGDIRAAYALLHIANSTSRIQFRRAKYRPENTTIPRLREIRWLQDPANVEIYNYLKQRFSKEQFHPNHPSIRVQALNKMKASLLGSDIFKKENHSTKAADKAYSHETQKLNEVTGILAEDILIPLLQRGRLGSGGS